VLPNPENRGLARASISRVQIAFALGVDGLALKEGCLNAARTRYDAPAR
jgi:hypothetical protein